MTLVEQKSLDHIKKNHEETRLYNAEVHNIFYDKWDFSTWF